MNHQTNQRSQKGATQHPAVVPQETHTENLFN